MLCRHVPLANEAVTRQHLASGPTGVYCTGPIRDETRDVFFSGVWRDRLAPEYSYRLLGKVLTNKNLNYQLKFAILLCYKQAEQQALDLVQVKVQCH